MEKYLKMPAGFDGGAEWFGNAMRDDMTASDVLIDAAVHAINSHDELVAMNKELLAALEAVIEWYDMEADHSIEPDFYKRMAACQVSEDMAREAIAKAKGTA